MKVKINNNKWIKNNIFMNLYNKYKKFNNNKIYVLKKCIKLFKNIIYILILYIYMPEIFINNSNINNDNDKMLFMACFIVFSGIMSYILQNYQCKPPESASNIAYNIDDVNNIEVTGWKRILIRILLAMR